MHIGQVIRSLREEKGWTQEKLALDAGMGTSHVSRIERGERRLPTELLSTLAAALGTTPAAIYARQEGLKVPEGVFEEDGDLAMDYSPEAVELRKAFRKLPLPSRQLLVDFARMLVGRTAL